MLRRQPAGKARFPDRSNRYVTIDPILDPLNDAQREAVLATRGPVLIIAGPGSGKTRVIAHRIAYLIDREGVPPYRVLAVTFTNKAAREMRDRVEGLLGEAARDVVLGTFHSVCARFLRIDGGRVGLGRGFNIYDEEDQQALMRRALNDLGLDPKQFHPRAVLSVISRAKSELTSPSAFKQSVRSYFEEVSARLYQRYQDLLAENNAVDFDDLIMKAVELLRDHADVREKFQQRFLHVLIDEFQDTNVAQYVLARQLAAGHGNICVVGDPDQSIYSWRSADIRNILNFERDYPAAKVVVLERNYRSTQRILNTAQAVIRASSHGRGRRLWTDRGEGLPIVTFEAADEVEEAEFVAAEILDAIRRGERKPGDFAVMYRTNAQSRAIEEAFIREGIPYRLVGGVRFYQRREVKDILAYLRLVYNPFDTLSFARIVNVPPRGIGVRTLEELERWAAESGVPVYTALHLLRDEAGPDARGGHPLTPRAAKALLGFLDLLDDLMRRASEVSLSTLLSDLLDRIAYRRYLLDQFDDGEDRWENVQELRTVAAEYDGLAPDAALPTFLENVALVSDVDELESVPNAVTLITLHAAKGLEFPVVFITGMEEGMLPHLRSFDDPAQMEEERRLCYVGITRAKEQLYLTRAFVRHVMGAGRHNPPSRFLKDIPDDVLAPRQPIQAEAAQLRERRFAPVEAAFAAGDRVRHARFGMGTVIQCRVTGEDQEVTVVFAEGIGVKRLLLSYAPLEKVG